MALINTYLFGKCYCLNSDGGDDDCFRRKKYIRNIAHFCGYDCISVCNEYLRLLYHKKHEESHWADSNISQEAVIDMWNQIIMEVYNLQKVDLVYKNNNYTKSLSDINLNIELCSRPLIFRSIKLPEAINLCLSSKTYLHLNSIIAHEIREWVLSSKYKHYKSNCENILKLTNKLKNVWDERSAELLINEILAKIIKQEAKETESISP